MNSFKNMEFIASGVAILISISGIAYTCRRIYLEHKQIREFELEQAEKRNSRKTIRNILQFMNIKELSIQIANVVELFSIEQWKEFFNYYHDDNITTIEHYIKTYLLINHIIPIKNKYKFISNAMKMPIEIIPNNQIIAFIEKEGLHIDNVIKYIYDDDIRYRHDVLFHFLSKDDYYSLNGNIHGLLTLLGYLWSDHLQEILLIKGIIPLQKDFNYINNKLLINYDIIKKNIRVNDSINITFECNVCFENIKSDYGIKTDCKHLICKDCIRQYIEYIQKELITNKFNMNLNKPCCKDMINANWICSVAKIFNTYLSNKELANIIHRKRASQHPYMTDCPDEYCDGYAFIHPDESRLLECSSCHKEQVFQGRNYDNSHLTDTDKLLSLSNFGKCPKCNRMIEKNGGCPHMKCGFCKYEFHWTTKLQWRN